MTIFEAAAPEGIFFGWKIKWGSHVDRVSASARNIGGTQETTPTIHSSNEVTHFLGDHWLDNFSDRLYVTTPDQAAGIISWQSLEGTITFAANNGWKSWGGVYALVDRQVDPHLGSMSDGYGRWVVETLDTRRPKKIWSFEEFQYVDTRTGTTNTLGRLRRHAVLNATQQALDGRYGFTITWQTNGAIQSVVDSLDRQLLFSYATLVSGTTTWQRYISEVQYKPSAASNPFSLSLPQLARGNRILDSVRRPTGDYKRFLYSAPCLDCDPLLSSVIAGSGMSPAPQSPLLAGETELEHNEYTLDPSTGQYLASYSLPWPRIRLSVLRNANYSVRSTPGSYHELMLQPSLRLPM